tara:strand:- start:818 stop:2500 length:1683 start_codon:yes stop_codon:yes gene_type:complete
MKYLTRFFILLVTPVFAKDALRPNIVIIMSDDMGYSDIGCYGGEIHTPVLDGLAANGLRFTQFYNTARCCPTRASLLTGLYPHQAGIGHMMNDRGQDGYRGELNRNCVTIAEALKPAGYSTYCIGKWHVTSHVNPSNDTEKFNWPLQRGFDRYYGIINGASSLWDPNSLTRGNKPITRENDPDYKPSQPYHFTDAISDNAVKFVKEHKGDNPFFMYVSYTAAHWPMHAREQDIEKYDGKYDQGYVSVRKARLERMKEMGLIDNGTKMTPTVGDWSKVKDKEWESACMEVYAAMVDQMDQGIGRIVEAIKIRGDLNNTLIFYLQDNGGCAENGGRGDKPFPRPKKPTFKPIPDDVIHYFNSTPKQTRDGYPVRRGRVMPGPEDTYIGYGRNWANVSNTPFREYKHWVHEGGVATPLVVHWPDGIAVKNKLRKEPSHLIDLMATCIDVSGATYPREFRGKTIKPLEGKSLVKIFKEDAIDRQAIYWEHEGNRAIRVGDWKLVAKGRNGKWELYNLKNDRVEMNDLSKKHSEKTKKLQAMWQSYAERTGVIPWPESRKKNKKK